MLKVLIADDEGFVRSGLINNIQWNKLGVDTIEQATDGVIAYEKSLVFEPDIIITDIRMPRMDGIEFSTKIRKKLPNCKIIIISAYPDKEYFKSAITLNATRFVEKPINLNEINDAILEAADLCRAEENIRLRTLEKDEKYKDSVQVLLDNVAIDLVRSNQSKIELISKWLEKSDIEIATTGRFSVFIVKHELKGNVDLDMLNFKETDVINSIKQMLLLQDIESFCSIKDDKSILYVIYKKPLAKRQLSIYDINKVCANILDQFRKEYAIFIGIGKIVHGIENVVQSYRSAVVSSQQLFYKGYHNFSYVEDSQLQKKTYNFTEAVSKAFEAYLIEGQKNKLISFINELIREIKKYDNTLINTVKNELYLLMLQVVEISSKRRIPNLFEGNSKTLIWNEMSEIQTLDDVEIYFIKLINTYFDKIDELEGSSRIVSNIIKEVQFNYSDKDLSIESLGERLQLSNSYLSIIFKKETGKTINQYITEYRINKAKEIFRDTDGNVFDVAVRVGFTDQNYFTKVFKKLTDMTPSEYRKRSR